MTRKEMLLAKMEKIVDVYGKWHKEEDRDYTEDLLREIEQLKTQVEELGIR